MYISDALARSQLYLAMSSDDARRLPSARKKNPPGYSLYKNQLDLIQRANQRYISGERDWNRVYKDALNYYVNEEDAVAFPEFIEDERARSDYKKQKMHKKVLLEENFRRTFPDVYSLKNEYARITRPIDTDIIGDTRSRSEVQSKPNDVSAMQYAILTAVQLHHRTGTGEEDDSLYLRKADHLAHIEPRITSMFNDDQRQIVLGLTQNESKKNVIKEAHNEHEIINRRKKENRWMLKTSAFLKEVAADLPDF
jgi:hypothetical protein